MEEVKIQTVKKLIVNTIDKEKITKNLKRNGVNYGVNKKIYKKISNLLHRKR